MLHSITPEQAGISSAHVEKFLRKLEQRGLYTHSVLLMRGNDIFAEAYWNPFHRDFNHRMYSQTKSYVAVAIGLLEEDGKLSLDDPMYKYFPDLIERELPENMKLMTIRHMLTMETCGGAPNWFKEAEPNRTKLYLNKGFGGVHPGMRWGYDSGGSQVLSSLVERLSGMSLFDFLNERIFRHLGTFKTAHILKTKNDDSWGDSALLCTPRDMASFARFVMNYGTWNGKRLMNEAYLKAATSPLVSNDCVGFDSHGTGGYGYQIWTIGEDCFFFNGMGCQLTFCYPKQDLIMVMTADNDGFGGAKYLIHTALQDFILDNLHDAPLPEDPKAEESLNAYVQTLELGHIKGRKVKGCAAEINGKVWKTYNESKTGITQFSLRFTSEDEGELRYTNAQGDKVLPFGIGKNVFCKFPQEGYSTLHGGLENTDGYLYDCAVSAAWREEKKLQMKVQIIDEYFGNAIFSFAFDGDEAMVIMFNEAENFMEEYIGRISAKLDS